MSKKSTAQVAGVRQKPRIGEVHDGVQLYFPYSVDSPHPPLRPLRCTPSTNPSNSNERDKLEQGYAALLSEQPAFRKLVTYVPNKRLAVYNWFKYKEGFSRELVVRLADKFSLQAGDILYDPFVGCGTTTLAARELGLAAIGTDILDTAVFVARVKCMNFPTPGVLETAVSRLLKTPYKNPRAVMPDVRIVALAYLPAVRDEILFFKETISRFRSGVREFLMLGLLSVLEEVSSTSKDGQFLRLVEKRPTSVREALRNTYAQMLGDLGSFFLSQVKAAVQPLIIKGDARTLCLPSHYAGKIAAVITSPPYLNRYDYSRTYALELCLLSVTSHKEMVAVRHSLLRSHVESKEQADRGVALPALDEILRCLRGQNLNNNRVPVMIQGYFEDMNLVIGNLAHYLRPGGRVALVVANAQFAGEHVPTDLLLCELARAHGLQTDEIWITRFKGNSSQQMAIYGRRPVRESILFWRKM